MLFTPKYAGDLRLFAKDMRFFQSVVVICEIFALIHNGCTFIRDQDIL